MNITSQLSDLRTRWWRLLRVLGSEAKKDPGLLAQPAELRKAVRESPLRRTLDPRIEVWEQQIDDAYAAQNWVGVVDIMRAVLRVTSAMDTPSSRVKLIHSHVKLGHPSSVESQFELSLKRHPNSDILLLARAEHAMAQRDYQCALDFWDRGLREGTGDAQPVLDLVVAGLPRRGAIFAWDEAAWVECVDRWDAIWETLDREPSLLLYRRLIHTLFTIGEYGLAQKLSERALSAHPHDEALVVQAAELVVRSNPDMGATRLKELLRQQGGEGTAGRLAAQIEQAEVILEDIAELGAPSADELRILTVYRHSPAEFLIRASNFWDERRVHEVALRLATRDGWPEQSSNEDLVSAAAWAAAREFASTRAEVVRITPGALARAVFHYFKQELTQKIPVDRIADEIARTRDDVVFVDLAALKIPYMVSYPTSKMQAMYFYHALRKRGRNVTFVRFPRMENGSPSAGNVLESWPMPTPMPVLTLIPQPAQLKPPARPLKPVRAARKSLLVPAGIRSVRRVLDRIGPTVVVNSGSAVKQFAYDRSIKQDWDYDVNLSLHGDGQKLLPTFKFHTEPVITWRRDDQGVMGSPAAPSTPESIDAFLASGEWVSDDWNEWLERAIVPFFRDFVHRVRDTVDELGIVDVHVGDYLYAEPALVAAVVKERGGRVHVWPHSTNPVHVALQDPNLIDTVHAVTRSGATTWRQALPRARVQHDSSLMLDPPRSDVAFSTGEPLSVVVIGGRPVMRHLPILDIAAHEDLYRRFFAALEPLVATGRVRVYFKPRGLTGEHEGWLEKLVGHAAGWQPVLEHPLRMTLANPLFVSLSVGSSALLEGGTRGIPGLVVREGFARDYLATDESLFQALSVSEAVEMIDTLAEAEAWTSNREALMAALARELATEPKEEVAAFPSSVLPFSDGGTPQARTAKLDRARVP